MSQPLKNQRIGFIGLGLMGRPMADHLLAAGAELVIFNRSQEVVKELVAQGARAAASAAEVAREVAGGLIGLNLPRTEAVEAVLGLEGRAQRRGEQEQRREQDQEQERDRGQDTEGEEGGLLRGLAAGTVVIDFGTSSVAATKRFVMLAEKRGAGWVDAPVSGGQVGARAASLTIMAGGKAADYERARAVFQVVGAKSTHLGPSGSGQVAKLANQLIVAQTIDAVAQALAMAEAAGVDSGKLREALRGGFADSRILELHGDRMVRRDFAPGGRAELQLKDVRLIHELATDLGLKFPTLDNSLRQWITMVEEKGLGGLDHSGLFRLYVPER